MKQGGAIQRNVAKAVYQSVVTATPVGNPNIWREPDKAPKGYVGGNARRNWLVGIGEARTDVVDAAEDGTAAINSAFGDGMEIHISNNVPYIVPLNEGHSHQAPAAFVEIAIATGVAAIKSARILGGGK